MLECHGPVPCAVRHRQVVAGGFLVAEASYRPYAVLEEHGHINSSLTFVLDGEFEERIGRRFEDLRPESLLIKPPGGEHADRMGASGARILFIEPTEERCAMLQDALPMLQRVAFTQQESVALAGLRLRRELWRDGAASQVMVEGLVLQLLAAADRDMEPRLHDAPAWLREVRDRLAAEFVSPPSITLLALEAGVSPTYLIRAFRRHYGVPPTHFLRHRRIEWACDAILHSPKQLGVIAHEAGFADQSHFGRTFKAFTGLTPAEFRRMGRGRGLVAAVGAAS